MKIVIVGASAGGAGVAARLRRLDEHAQISLFERSHTASFATCGIPYYLGEVITDRTRLNVVDTEDFENILGVSLNCNVQVETIDRAAKTLQVRDLKSGQSHTHQYDKLVLAPGGSAVTPPIKGIEQCKRLFSVRNAEDTDALKTYITENQSRSATIVGGGFIGVEMAENLRTVGMQVNIIEAGAQLMNLWDYEMAVLSHQQLRNHGVDLYLRQRVVEIDDRRVLLDSGLTLESDLIVLAAGIKPDTRLARQCGITVGPIGGIKTNEFMQTNDPDIYALGDAVEVVDRFSHQPMLMPLAGLAQKQARVVAEHMVGRRRRFNPVQTSAITKIFNQTLALTGSSEKKLRAAGIPYLKTYIDATSHAGFYPDAQPLLIKLLYTRDNGKVLGAQIAGNTGVDKRIDVIATIINTGNTIYDLAELELSYAPPFSSAKDPVNVAGMVAVNQLEKNHRALHWHELPDIDLQNSLLIDVRTAEEYELSHLEHSINIPLTELRTRLPEIPKDKKLFVYCAQGKKGYFASRILSQHGYSYIANLSGGLRLFNAVTNEQKPQTVKPLELPAVKKTTEKTPRIPDNLLRIDACGMNCPGPIMKLSQALRNVRNGDMIEISATDSGFAEDVKTWCRKKQCTLVRLDNQKGKLTALLVVGMPEGRQIATQ